MTQDVAYTVVDLPSVWAREVRDYDAGGREMPYDGSWHRDVSETMYLLAEFLAAKSLLVPGVDASRRRDLLIRKSQLTPLGLQFVRAHMDKWFNSLDRRKPGTP